MIQSPLVMAAAGLIAALSVLLGVWGFAAYSAGNRVASEDVLAPVRAKRPEGPFVLTLIAERVGRPFTGIAMDLLSPWRTGIRKRIDAAGRPNGLTLQSYAQQTAGFVVIFGGLGLVFALSGDLFIGGLIALGALQNELLLLSRSRSRQDDIERQLPDFLDVLSVTVSAGLSFRHALARVAESMNGAVAEEFVVALRQMELGTPRREAFEDLRQRNNSPAIGQFVSALLQAEELGAPLTAALMDIAEDMRRESAQWSKRRAQRLTPRITAVTTALTLPAMMIVMLGSLFFGSGLDFSGIPG